MLSSHRTLCAAAVAHPPVPSGLCGPDPQPIILLATRGGHLSCAGALAVRPVAGGNCGAIPGLSHLPPQRAQPGSLEDKTPPRPAWRCKPAACAPLQCGYMRNGNQQPLACVTLWLALVPVPVSGANCSVCKKRKCNTYDIALESWHVLTCITVHATCDESYIVMIRQLHHSVDATSEPGIHQYDQAAFRLQINQISVGSK